MALNFIAKVFVFATFDVFFLKFMIQASQITKALMIRRMLCPAATSRAFI
jgi:hypothetical protein